MLLSAFFTPPCTIVPGTYLLVSQYYCKPNVPGSTWYLVQNDLQTQREVCLEIKKSNVNSKLLQVPVGTCTVVLLKTKTRIKASKKRRRILNDGYFLNKSSYSGCAQILLTAPKMPNRQTNYSRLLLTYCTVSQYSNSIHPSQDSSIHHHTSSYNTVSIDQLTIL